MSAQSMDEKVLNNIKRSNIKLEDYTAINKHLRNVGRSTTAELIIGLPGETKKVLKKVLKKSIPLKWHYQFLFGLLDTKNTESHYQLFRK